jgi:hypothetical protein
VRQQLNALDTGRCGDQTQRLLEMIDRILGRFGSRGIGDQEVPGRGRRPGKETADLIAAVKAEVAKVSLKPWT